MLHFSLVFVLYYVKTPKDIQVGDTVRKKKQIVPLDKSDVQFFHNFLEENYNYLYRTVSSYTSDAADQDDLFQETMIRLMKNISVLRNLTRCKTAHYIVITVRTAYIDTLRQKKDIYSIPLNDDDDLLEALPRDIPAGRSEKDIHLRMEVRRLKENMLEKDWMVLVGKFVIGYTHEELGTMLEMNPASVRMALSRAKAKAREILQIEDWIGDD